MNAVIKLSGILLATLISNSAWADTLRCGNQLISTGDRAFEVERKCGQPLYRDPVSYSGGRYEPQEVLIEEWVYGPNNGAYNILRFEGNRLTKIETRREH